MVAVEERGRLAVNLHDVDINHAQAGGGGVGIAEILANALMRERVAVGDRPLPTGEGHLFAHFIEIPARVAVAFGGRGRTVADDFDARVVKVFQRAAKFAAGIARFAGQKFVPRGWQVDDRGGLVFVLFGQEARYSHRAGSAATFSRV